MKTPKANAIEIFKTGGVEIPVGVSGDSVWITQNQMADLFQTDISGISRHIKNIYDEGELQKKSTLQKMQVAISDKPVNHYNLDMIISVGYRVNSKVATMFRQWATIVLGRFVQDGFVLDGKRLLNDKEKLKNLAEQIRKIRLEEANIFSKVKDVFKATASDYDSTSQAAKNFFAMAQDKFHYAIVQKTAAEIIIERADATKPNMGLVHFSGNVPCSQEAKIGKNYLSEDELRALENISEQFLLFAESKAFRGQKMTMEELSFKLNTLLQANDYPILYEYKSYLRGKADQHAKKELEKYKRQLDAGSKKPTAIPKGPWTKK